MLYEALASECGLAVACAVPTVAQARFHTLRRQLADKALYAFQIVLAPDAEDEVWLIKIPEKPLAQPMKLKVLSKETEAEITALAAQQLLEDELKL
jgi:hypothetical protein